MMTQGYSLRKLDFFFLAALYAAVLLYQLQLVFPKVAALHIREILFAYLYVRAFFFYPIPTNSRFILLLSYIGFALCVGFHTFFLFGPTMAVVGYMRFVGITLLAPLTAILVTEAKQVKTLVNIWVVIVVLGAGTAIYQFLGGTLPTLVQGYVAVRGGLPRFKTLLGEPNIGGMASAFCLALAAVWYQRRWIKVMVTLTGLAMCILSGSKAAILGIAVVFALITLMSPGGLRQLRSKSVLTLRQLWRDHRWATIISSGIFVILAWLSPLRLKIQSYAVMIIGGVFGMHHDGGGVGDDLPLRLIYLPAKVLRLLLDEEHPLINVIIGGSYGVAGSASSNLPTYNLPHNGTLEIFFVGGFIFLFLFLALSAVTSLHLCRLAMKERPYLGLFVSFWLALYLNFTYPIIYAPTIGGIFWLIVGFGANAKIARQVHALGYEGAKN